MSRRSASDFRRTSKRQVWVTVPHMKRICPTKTGLSPTNLQKTAKIYEQAARKYVSQMLEDINVLPAAFSSNIHFSLPDAVLRPRAVADSWGAAGAAGASEAGATDGSAASEASLLTTALPLDNVQETRGISSKHFIWKSPWNGISFAWLLPLNRAHDLGSYASCVTRFVRAESSTSSQARSGGMSTCMLERENLSSDTTFPIYFPI